MKLKKRGSDTDIDEGYSMREPKKFFNGDLIKLIVALIIGGGVGGGGTAIIKDSDHEKFATKIDALESQAIVNKSNIESGRMITDEKLKSIDNKLADMNSTLKELQVEIRRYHTR